MISGRPEIAKKKKEKGGIMTFGGVWYLNVNILPLLTKNKNFSSSDNNIASGMNVSFFNLHFISDNYFFFIRQL